MPLTFAKGSLHLNVEGSFMVMLGDVLGLVLTLGMGYLESKGSFRITLYGLGN